MNKFIRSAFFGLAVLTVLMSGCTPARTPVTPTSIPATPTSRPATPTSRPEPTSTAAPSQITIVEAPGNLESTQDIGCTPVSDLKNTYTPPDLYLGMSQCIKEADYSSAAFFFVLAGTYGYYDTLRVADITAHDAKAVLVQQSLVGFDSTQKEALQQELQRGFGNPDNLPALCDEMVRIGAPQYYPRYMIQHGMDAISGGNPEDALVKDFDPQAAWNKALEDYVHCPNLTPAAVTPTTTPDPNATPVSMPGKDTPITVGGARILITVATNDIRKIHDSEFMDKPSSPGETTLYIEAQIVSGEFDPFSDGIFLTDNHGTQYSRGITGWADANEFKKPYWQFRVPKASKSLIIHFQDGQMFKLDLILELVP